MQFFFSLRTNFRKEKQLLLLRQRIVSSEKVNIMLISVQLVIQEMTTALALLKVMLELSLRDEP